MASDTAGEKAERGFVPLIAALAHRDYGEAEALLDNYGREFEVLDAFFDLSRPEALELGTWDVELVDFLEQQFDLGSYSQSGADEKNCASLRWEVTAERPFCRADLWESWLDAFIRRPEARRTVAKRPVRSEYFSEEVADWFVGRFPVDLSASGTMEASGRTGNAMSVFSGEAIDLSNPDTPAISALPWLVEMGWLEPWEARRTAAARLIAPIRELEKMTFRITDGASLLDEAALNRLCWAVSSGPGGRAGADGEGDFPLVFNILDEFSPEGLLPCEPVASRPPRGAKRREGSPNDENLRDLRESLKELEAELRGPYEFLAAGNLKPGDFDAAVDGVIEYRASTPPPRGRGAFAKPTSEMARTSNRSEDEKLWRREYYLSKLARARSAAGELFFGEEYFEPR